MDFQKLLSLHRISMGFDHRIPGTLMSLVMAMVPAPVMMSVVNQKKYHCDCDQEDHQAHYFIEEFKNLVHKLV